MFPFVKRHPLMYMVLALAILLALVVTLINLAYNKLEGIYFFVAWIAIILLCGFLLLKIIDYYEIIEILKYQEYKKKQEKTNKAK